jgi:hypothetical protein
MPLPMPRFGIVSALRRRTVDVVARDDEDQV